MDPQPRNIQSVIEVTTILRDPKYCISNLQIKAARSEIASYLGVEATMKLDKISNKQELLDQIANLENIAFAIESE